MSRRHPAGQALVEFAIAIPVLLLLVLGLLDFGRAVYAYNTVANAAREAVRVAIVDQDAATVEAIARVNAVAIADARLTVDVAGVLDTGCRKIGCTTRVRVEYVYVPITPIIGSLIGSVTVASETEMPIERVHDSVP